MKKIDFLATDGLKLNGLLYESNQKTDKVILSVHGMSSNCLKNREDILSKCMNQNNIDYFCFNNRGSELVRYIQKDINGEKEKLLGGTTYEAENEDLERILNSGDIDSYMEKLAREDYGYAYPDEYRFYDTSRN